MMDSDLKVEELFDRMAKTYAACKSYQDTGVVKTVFFHVGGIRTTVRPFKTAFIRPDRFRFEYLEDEETFGQEQRYIVWREGRNVQTWSDITPGVEKVESFNLALAGATGVSGGSAHSIPALLLPEEVVGWRLTEMKNAKRVDDAAHEKVDCFRVEGNSAESFMTLWIDKEKYLIYRIDEQTQFPDFRTEEMTTYCPAIDGEITDQMLEFDPPKLK